MDQNNRPGWQPDLQDAGHRTRRILPWIMGVALVLRLAAAVYLGDGLTGKQQERAYDQISYNLLAQSILAGKGYSFEIDYYPGFTPANTPTAHWSFLYPLYLSGVYAFTGFHPLAARLLQIVIISLLETWLVFRLGRALFNETVGLVGAGLSAVYAYLIFYDATLMTEPFFISAILAILLLGLRLSGMAKDDPLPSGKPDWSRKKWFEWAVLGGVVGAAALLRQTILLWMPFQIIWMNWVSYRRIYRWRPAVLGSLITLSVAAIFVLPWTMRNYAVYDAFLPLNSNAGYALYSANHPDHGTRFDQDYAAPLPDDLLSQGLNEAGWNTALTLRGLEFIRQDPLRYLRLTASKAGVHFNFWFSAESSLASNLMRVLSFGIYLPFFIAGLVLSFKDWKRCSIIYLFVILFNLLHILTWSGIRYRLPVDAALMPFAGLALISIFAWMKKK